MFFTRSLPMLLLLAAPTVSLHAADTDFEDELMTVESTGDAYAFRMAIHLDDSHDICLIRQIGDRVHVDVLQFELDDYPDLDAWMLRYALSINGFEGMAAFASDQDHHEFEPEPYLPQWVQLEAYGGHDIIIYEDMMAFAETFAGDGDDLVEGVQYDDIWGYNYILGGAGRDEIHGGPGRDEIYGGPGNDKIFGYDRNDVLHGDEGNDRIFGGAGRDWCHGGADNDHIVGDGDGDWLYGGPGDDTLHGNDGGDDLHGGDGDDEIYGGAGEDSLFGDAGQDYLDGGFDGDQDFLEGGDDDDDFVFRRYKLVAFKVYSKLPTDSRLGSSGTTRESIDFVIQYEQLTVEMDRVLDYEHGDEYISERVR